MTTHVGVDIGARTVVMGWRKDDHKQAVASYAQTPQGHAQLVRRLVELKPDGVVLEATGVYYLDLAVALFQAGLPVSVINPRSFHHFAKLELSGSKSDPTDAALLAEYSQRMSPAQWMPPSLAQLTLRDLGRQLNRLTALRTQAKNSIRHLYARGV